MNNDTEIPQNQSGTDPVSETPENNQESTSEVHSENQSPASGLDEVAEWQDKYVRLYSEFDNFRKRTSRERIDLIKTAGQDVIVSLLPVIDDFDRSLKAMETATDLESVKEGVQLISHKFKTILSAKGLETLDALGKPFDLEIHEAITNIPAKSEQEIGLVVDELEKGYKLGDKVIRFAKVVVAQ